MTASSLKNVFNDTQPVDQRAGFEASFITTRLRCGHWVRLGVGPNWTRLPDPAPAHGPELGTPDEV
jgi:hypothetical protein